MTAKQLLLKQTAEAFSGRADMPLMAALEGITDQEASWRIDDATPTIEQLVRHIAWAKSSFCAQGFGTPMAIDDATVNADGDSPDLPIEAMRARMVRIVTCALLDTEPAEEFSIEKDVRVFSLLILKIWQKGIVAYC